MGMSSLPETGPRIAILGAGNMGTALAKALVLQNRSVAL